MTPAEFRAAVEARVSAAGGSLAPEVLEPLARYFELLRAWSRRINLTGFDLEVPTADALDRLFVEPLLVAPAIPEPVNAMVDIGSGGGSPGIPLIISLQPTSARLIESRSRKCTFLREVIRALDLSRVEVEPERFETLAERHAGRFDLLSVRAVTLDAVRLRTLERFLAPGARLVHFGSHELPLGGSVLEVEKTVALGGTSTATIARWPR